MEKDTVQQARSGFFMSRKLIVIVFLFVIMSFAAVGLIVGMFNHNLERVVYNNSFSLECLNDNSTTPTTTTTPVPTTTTTTTPAVTTTEQRFPPGPWLNSPSLPSYILPVRYKLHIKYVTFTAPATSEQPGTSTEAAAATSTEPVEGSTPITEQPTTPVEVATSAAPSEGSPATDDDSSSSASTEANRATDFHIDYLNYESSLVIEAVNRLRENRFIVFHTTKDLTFTSDLVFSVTRNESLEIETKFWYPRYNYYVIILRQKMSFNESLQIRNDFKRNTSPLHPDSQTGGSGLFLYEFLINNNNNSDKRSILATNFKPIYARNVFPCFDEPSLRTPVDLKIEHPLDTQVVSNFAQDKSTLDSSGRYRVTTFSSSFPLSPHLISWMVAPDSQNGFSSVKEGNIAIHGRPEFIGQNLADFALKAAVKFDNFYRQTWFSANNTVSRLQTKLDIAAIPNLNNNEGSATPGLITVSERFIFFDENENTLEDKQMLLLKLSKMMAKIWIEGSAAANWNEHFWFNEALANVLSLKAVDAEYPELRILDHYVGSELVELIWRESFDKPNPIKFNGVDTPDRILSAFELANYRKASEIVRMLESIVSEDVFKNAVNAYLSSSNSDLSVFYANLVLPKEVQGVSTQAFVESWINQQNYPKITITLEQLAADDTSDFRKMYVKQEQFMSFNQYDERRSDQDKQSPGILNKPWYVYLKCIANDQDELVEFQEFISSQEAEFAVPVNYTWVKCNRDLTGLYLFDYDEATSAKISQDLGNPELLDERNRANIVHDTFAIAFLDKYVDSYDKTKMLTKYMKDQESEYLPWRMLVWSLNKLASLSEQKNFYPLSESTLDFIKPISDKLSIWNASANDTQNRFKSMLVDFNCRMVNPDCLKTASANFAKLKDYLNGVATKNPLPPSQRLNVYKYHLQETFIYEDWKKLRDKGATLADVNQRLLIGSALASSKSTWILNNFLRETLAAKNVNNYPEFYNILSSVSVNSAGRYVSWYFFKNTWKSIATAKSSFAESLLRLTESFDNAALLEELLAFLDQDGVSTALTEYDIDRYISHVLNNINWHKKYQC